MTSLPATDLISTHELQLLMASRPDLKVLDVRTGAEFETVHIPGSFNVPLDTLAEHVRELADVHHPVVLVCQSGGRATAAHQSISGAGKSSVHILEGGMASWIDADGDVTRTTTTKWAMDRQVRFTAGSLALAGLIASVAVPKAKWLSAGVASGLVWSAVSNTCTMGDVLAKLPYNRGAGCDIEGVLLEMNASSPSTSPENLKAS